MRVYPGKYSFLFATKESSLQDCGLPRVWQGALIAKFRRPSLNIPCLMPRPAGEGRYKIEAAEWTRHGKTPLLGFVLQFRGGADVLGGCKVILDEPARNGIEAKLREYLLHGLPAGWQGRLGLKLEFLPDNSILGALSVKG